MNYNQVNVTGLRKLEPNKRGVKPPAGGAKEDSQKTSEWAKQGSGILVRNSGPEFSGRPNSLLRDGHNCCLWDRTAIVLERF